MTPSVGAVYQDTNSAEEAYYPRKGLREPCPYDFKARRRPLESGDHMRAGGWATAPLVPE